jgi:hypothetical protein
MINKKLGYYTVNHREFDSKLQACFYASKTNQDIKWHFNDLVFNNYPWANEPEETLDELYNRRARQLREEYDHIIISYSGGADSHNVVESFLRQKLHIDEIVVNTMESINKDTVILDPSVKNPENAAAEHYLQTLPRLKEIQIRSPKTKIEILDLSDYLLKSWLSAGDASWVMDKKEGLNPLNVTRFNYLHFNKIRQQFDKGKKIALILGIEKPRTIIHHDNNFYLRFVDRASNIITIENHIKEYTNSVVEYFYWSPDSAKMICKQAHTIKKWLEQFPEYQPSWYYKNLDLGTFRLVHERLLRTLLYSTWNDEWYQADKAISDWYSEFDSWFIKGFKGTKQHDIWIEGIKFVEENASRFVSDVLGYGDGLRPIDKFYLIGNMKTELSPELRAL